MNRDRDEIEHRILPRVAKPNRYIGNHQPGAVPGAVGGDGGAFNPGEAFAASGVRVLVLHPDLFESGFHDAVSAAVVQAAACAGGFVDRAYLPWPDLLSLLRAGGTPLWGLATFRPAAEFDLIVFTPSTPLQSVSVLRLLELCGLPLRADARLESAPLTLALGAAVANPAPLAPALDLFGFGAPAALLPAVVFALQGRRGTALSERRALLAALPGLLDARRAAVPGADAVPARAVEPATWDDVDLVHAGIPLVEVHDDALRLPIRRGGTALRFSGDEGNWLTPWHLDPEGAFPLVEAALRRFGLDRVDLTGDAPAEHPELGRLVEGLVRRHPGLRIHIDDFGCAQPDPALARELLRGKRATFTWSPLAGTDRLRRVLNRPVDEDRFLTAVATALRGGCHLLRLRFGVGWPTEDGGDLESLLDLVNRVKALGGQGSPPPRIQILLEPFLARPHSAFERQPLLSWAELAERLSDLRRRLEQGPVQVRHPPLDQVPFEASLLRGGPEVFAALVEAAARGATPGQPGEAWQAAAWLGAWQAAGVDLDAATAARSPEGPLPWDAVELGLPRAERRAECDRAMVGQPALSAGLAHLAEAILTRRPAAAKGGGAEESEPAVESRAFGRRGKRRSGPTQLLTAARFRVHFAKDAEVRFTAHLDVGRWFERALRRLDLSVGGGRRRSFKLSFGPPLPLGMTGDDEYLDLQFSEDVSEAYLDGLSRFLPPGCRLLDVRPVRSSVESLSQAVDLAAYRVQFPEALIEALPQPRRGAFFERLDDAVAAALSRSEIPAIRGTDGPVVNVRPALLSASLDGSVPGAPIMNLDLRLTAPGGGRPEMLLPALCGEPELDPRLALIHRVSLRISGAGREFTPLQVVEPGFPWWRDTMRRQSVGGRP